MAAEVDVYRDWLGIKETNRPLNYYQLLRLNMFEDDAEMIRTRYRKLTNQTRKYAAGQYGERSQQLMNELAKAMLCLTDASRKAEYDASLGRKTESKSGGLTLEEILIRRGVVGSPQLEKARNYANAVGVDVREALVQQKLASVEAVTQAYAESVGAPFINLNDLILDLDLLPLVPATIARQHSCVPVMVDDGQLLVASPSLLHPEVEEELRLRLGMAVRMVLCTPGQIHAIIEQHYTGETAEAELAGGGRKSDAGQATAAAMETKEDLGSEAAKRKQERITIPLIAATAAIVPALLALSFWNPLDSSSLGIGPLELGMAFTLGAVAAAIAFFLVASRR